MNRPTDYNAFLADIETVLFVPLSRGKFAVIDVADFKKVCGYRWRADRRHQCRTWYATAYNGTPTKLTIHRLITAAPKGMVVDHIDGDGLNNRRRNLRVCTTRINRLNRQHPPFGKSRYCGVVWHRKARRWQSQLGCQGKTYYLGLHDNEESAARAYDAAANRIFGELAVLNFKVAK